MIGVDEMEKRVDMLLREDQNLKDKEQQEFQNCCDSETRSQDSVINSGANSPRVAHKD